MVGWELVRQKPAWIRLGLTKKIPATESITVTWLQSYSRRRQAQSFRRGQNRRERKGNEEEQTKLQTLLSNQEIPLISTQEEVCTD